MASTNVRLANAPSDDKMMDKRTRIVVHDCANRNTRIYKSMANYSKSLKNCVGVDYTNLIPRRTDRPLTISNPRSTSDARTITKSNTFHPLRKKSNPPTPNLRTHSVVKTAVNTCAAATATKQ